MDALIILLIYFTIINLISFICYGIDKSRARRSRWRLSEGSLISLAIFGGSVGSLLGMYIFRHKTQKPRFSIGIPVILVLQILLLTAILILKPFDLSFM